MTGVTSSKTHLLLFLFLTVLFSCKKHQSEKFVYYLKVKVEGRVIDSIIPYSKAPVDPVEMVAKLHPNFYINIVDRDDPPPQLQNYWQFQMIMADKNQGTGVFYESQLVLEGRLDHQPYIYVNPWAQTTGDSTLTLSVTRSEQGSVSNPGILEAQFSVVIMKRNGITQEDISIVPISGSFAVPLTGE